MEHNAIIYEKFGPDLAGDSQPSYSTEYRSLPPSAPPPSLFSKARIRRGLIWGIVSTVLSAIGLIGLALFEQYNGMLSELRGDLKHFNETTGEYVKKDRFQKCWDRLRDCSNEITASNEARTRLEAELKASGVAREETLKELQRLRERLAYVEGMKAAGPRFDSANNYSGQDGKTSRQ